MAHDGLRPEARTAAHAAHWRRQVRLGLALTPAQRLQWLESTMAQMRRWCGRARALERARSSEP